MLRVNDCIKKDTRGTGLASLEHNDRPNLSAIGVEAPQILLPTTWCLARSSMEYELCVDLVTRGGWQGGQVCGVGSVFSS